MLRAQVPEARAALDAVRRQRTQPQQPVGHVRDQSGQHGGGAGSLLRLLVLALIMVPITAAVMLRAQVPEARAALDAVRFRITGRGPRP
ncbi:hypothetical protein MAHJHV51_56860 [Mycobacterium avium subsp. hominissuis]